MYGHMDVKHMNSSITKSRKPNEKWKIGAQLGRPVIWRSCDRASWQFDVHVTVHRNKLFIIKSTRCTNFSNFILGTKLYMFWTVPLSIIRSFSLYTQQWCMSYRFSDSLRTGSGWNAVQSWSCLQAVSKPVRHIPLLCVQWKTPDDWQRNCPKHVEFRSKINLRN